jgi:N6-L-threonylcarbamoyladenine synthase
MIGASIAKGLAIGFGKPYLAINHLEGHLLSPFFGEKTEIAQNVSLIVSGGHTLLIEVNGMSDYRVLGRTVDDAAGEAFDKVAKMLGLGYPGGPEIERHARLGNPARFDLPRSMLDSGDHNFSFSGLKTAMRYLLPKIGFARANVMQSEGDRKEVLNDLCASFQCAVIDVLVRKTIRAAKENRRSLVTVSGGVSCNQELRAQMTAACEGERMQVLFAAPELCTDNAAMIAFVAALRLDAGFQSSVTDEIDPNLALVGSG